MNLSQFLEDGELTVRGKLRAERGGVRIDYVILDQTWDASIDDLRTTSTTRGWARHRWNEAEGLYRSSYGGDVDQAELELLFTDPLLEGEPKAP